MQEQGMQDNPALLSLVQPSRRLLACFSAYLHWYIGRHFSGLRLAHGERFPVAAGPLIIYVNHASWWDPLTCIMLSRYLQLEADHYAPMDASALKHYTIFRRMGLFPVEAGSHRGAVQFLRAAREILATPNSVLWITPEGRFTDVRVRPLRFEPGLAALVSRLESCVVVPIACEYTFWDERLPEILLNCGEPMRIASGKASTTEDWNQEFATAMVRTQDELAALAALRDPALFTTVLSGKVGIGGVYEAWKRLLAMVSGRAYQGSHGSIRQ